jgi:uncharacterized protein
MTEIAIAGRIARSSTTKRETPEERRRKAAIQIIAGVVLIAIIVAVAFYSQANNPKGAYIWIIGIGFGYVLQRSRFCFTASLRDPILTGSTALTKAVIIAFALSSLAFAALQIKATGMSLETLDLAKLPGNIRDVGIHTILGGFIFGIGAVIAGGCASGTLMRMGEGFAQQWIAFVFFVVGSVIGAVILPSMQAAGLYTKGAVYLPQFLGGWVPALIAQFALLATLYVLADWYGKKKSGEL